MGGHEKHALGILPDDDTIDTTDYALLLSDDGWPDEQRTDMQIVAFLAGMLVMALLATVLAVWVLP